MRLSLLLAGLALVLPLPAMGQGQCLQSGGGPYTLEGQLSSGRFRDAAGRPESALLLVLKERICMTGSEEEDKVRGTNRIHVFGDDEATHRRLQGFVGRWVAVTGEPFGAHTSHHHAPIVFRVVNVQTR